MPRNPLKRGVVRYRYDERGNLIERSDPNLRARGKVVRHHYDGFGRISRREYPESEDVHYFYGDSTKKSINAVGRLIRRRDESGLHEFEYGKMGEVIRERRTLHSQRALHADQIALMSFKSDYLGRMSRIEYPDGEVIEYFYDQGGQLDKVLSTRKDGNQSREKYLIERIGYDEYGMRTFIVFGNGVRTDYSYDPYEPLAGRAGEREQLWAEPSGFELYL